MTQKIRLASADERNLFMLKKAMSFDIARYMLSCSHGRWDGAEKATRHINLCNTFMEYILAKEEKFMSIRYKDPWTAVHTGTQEFTNNLDEYIGFPLESRPDITALHPLFFDKFVEFAMNAVSPYISHEGDA